MMPKFVTVVAAPEHVATTVESHERFGYGLKHMSATHVPGFGGGISVVLLFRKHDQPKQEKKP